ncbi:maleylpyruvate isomerase family mycothiol-dependent enzyme [Actinomadura roseirufa]|uniref:maleylpyruvate isomerase family mycothiol-dependent enzyme n=1 Tax=Actinomadura roseirufa TaxID=2094049 RepID=UPI001041891E|nr:maleylpyruvate isomerase family mycothiol-dependent enzyme [Actinomadura roseirufa]
MSTPEPARLAEGLREHTAGMAAAVAGRDPAGPVPTCPQWRLRDLVVHVGEAHRWAADMVRTGTARETPDAAAAEPGAPDEWPAWLEAGARELTDAVGAEGPEKLVNMVFLGPRPAAFWLRRMLHDTSVHHADAALAAGLPFEIAADLAADGIGEWLELMTAPAALKIKPELAELRGGGETLALRPEERTVPGWLITMTPEGPRASRATDSTTDDSATGGTDRGSADTGGTDTGGASAVVRAPVRELLLVLSRRLSPEKAGAKVTGERAVLDHWLTHTAF